MEELEEKMWKTEEQRGSTEASKIAKIVEASPLDGVVEDLWAQLLQVSHIIAAYKASNSYLKTPVSDNRVTNNKMYIGILFTISFI